MRRNIFFRSFLLQACWNEERMQNIGFVLCTKPWLYKLYSKGSLQARQALRRHLEFFNTQPYMAGIVCGVVAKLEEAAVREPGRVARIGTLRGVLGSTLAGIGDKFFWGTYRPFCTAVALASGFILHLGGVSGAWAAGMMLPIYLFLFNVPALWMRWEGIRIGYESGEGIVEKMKQLSWQRQIGRLKRGGRVLSVALAVIALFLLSGNFPAPVFEKMPTRAAVFIGCLVLRSLRLSVLRMYGVVLGGSMAAALFWAWS